MRERESCYVFILTLYTYSVTSSENWSCFNQNSTGMTHTHTRARMCVYSVCMSHMHTYKTIHTHTRAHMCVCVFIAHALLQNHTCEDTHTHTLSLSLSHTHTHRLYEALLDRFVQRQVGVWFASVLRLAPAGYVCVCVCVYVRVSMGLCTCTCVYVCVQTHTHTHSFSLPHTHFTSQRRQHTPISIRRQTPPHTHKHEHRSACILLHPPPHTHHSRGKKRRSGALSFLDSLHGSPL
jgi:uncharacterized membrane protein